jgi:4-hydroxy-2-oxoheptanedioate aldolase
MFENRVKELLRSGKPAWGAAVYDSSPLVTKFSVDTGVDFLWIDTEHVPFGTESISTLPLICRRGNCVPVLRVAGLDAMLIKKALDIGASAVMVPQINNAEEARRAVQYAKYPPIGSRGVSPIWTFYLNVEWTTYLPQANDELCVIVQIETNEGIKNVESIADVGGVDILFAGPMDLSAAFGHIGNVLDPEVQNFLEQFPRRVAPSGKACGIPVDGFEQARIAFDRGYRFISIGDILMQGTAGVSASLKAAREYSDRVLRSKETGTETV